MLARLAPRPRSQQAAGMLREVFGSLPGDFAFRLWDGTELRIGSAEPRFTVFIKTAETFSRLLRDPSPLNFAEAYVESAIDIEGDLYAAMAVADAVEALALSPWRRAWMLASSWRRGR